MPGFDRHAQREIARGLKERAHDLGFEAIGITRAERLDEEARRLEQWLLEGRQGTMDWMERNFEKRIDPTRLVEGAESVISVLHNYYPEEEYAEDPELGRVSRYAWGEDYHEVLKEKLYHLYRWLDEEVGGDGIHGRVFVDSAPVLDKAWAARSGLGWIGKHTNLLDRASGSYFFIGELIVDLPLEHAADSPVADHCGSCTRCIEACPTDAIYRPYAVDANRCISYLTIEHRDQPIPEELQPGMGSWIFGCDVCQEVCPWNKFSSPTDETRFEPREDINETSVRDWIELELEEYEERFADSPVSRPGFEAFKRNVRIAAANVLEDWSDE